MVSWLAGRKADVKVKSDDGVELGSVPYRFWRTPFAQRTLVDGVVPAGVVGPDGGVAWVSDGVVDLIDQYLGELPRERVAALSHETSRPIADFRDMRTETDPAKRSERELEMEEFRRLSA